MNRRDFVAAGLTAALASTASMAAAKDENDQQSSGSPQHRFQLKYAPHFGMFARHAGGDLLAELEFMASQGFRALEDNRLRQREPQLQEQIGKKLAELNMEMGVFVAHGNLNEPTLATGKQEFVDLALADMRDSLEVAKRVSARWVTVVPGAVDPRLEPDYQTANVVEALKRMAEVCEPSGLVMVLEPLNHWTNHPGAFLWKIPQAFLVCKAVNSPSCKILFDIYHQQISEGNLIPNIDMAWDEVGYFQTGDNPGRKEPGTGEINYRNIFRHIHGKGYEGILGMEHGNSKPGLEGEQAVIDAYVQADRF